MNFRVTQTLTLDSFVREIRHTDFGTSAEAEALRASLLDAGVPSGFDSHTVEIVAL